MAHSYPTILLKMGSINEVFTTVNANNLKHLDEDSQRNELFLAIPNQDKVALSFCRPSKIFEIDYPLT